MKKFGKTKVNQSKTRFSFNFNTDIIIDEEQNYDTHYLLNQQYQRLKKTNEDSNNPSLTDHLTEKDNDCNKILSKKMKRLSELEASNLYNTLNVSESSTPEDIKQAYKRLCVLKHPDKGGNPDEFKRINEAYQILSLPVTRSIFDAFGSKSLSLINGIILQNKLSNCNEERVNESISQGDFETLAYLFKVNSYYNEM